MSIRKAFILICDACGREEIIEGESSRLGVRIMARDERGWKVSLTGTPSRPSMYDVKVDLCQDCREEKL